MRILLVAHPDDEILWFNALDFDKIIVVFSDRDDKPDWGDKRRQAIMKHPLNVECLNLLESGFWRDPTKYEQYEQNYKDLCEKLMKLKADEVWTHNAYGEYGHSDHILCYRACMDTLNCPVNGQDPKLYREIKQLYDEQGVWSWH